AHPDADDHGVRPRHPARDDHAVQGGRRARGVPAAVAEVPPEAAPPSQRPGHQHRRAVAEGRGPGMTTLTRLRSYRPQQRQLPIRAALGFGMGVLVHVFEIQPFIATLIGMFFARGLCYTISTQAYSIDSPAVAAIAQTQIPLGGDLHVSTSVLIALVVVLVAVYILHVTRFGRTVYAIGG